MGYAIMFGTCFCCRRTFGFNPNKVPSLRDADNVRQPVCKDCVDTANPVRIKNGLEPIHYAPDAYQPCEEGEL